MVKVVCCSCETAFKYEVVKDMKNCPVCGELLWDDEGESNEENEACESNDEVIVLEKKEDKVRCKSCGMSYEYDLAKTLKKCRACGRPLWDERYKNVEEAPLLKLNESEKGLMYFDQIIIYETKPEKNCVCLYCGECEMRSIQRTNKFEKIVDKEYAILNGNCILKCQGCGKVHKSRKILYKKKDHYTSLLPRCPICNSPMLKKITTGSKILVAAAIGAFALPYNSKTYECENCGYRF